MDIRETVKQEMGRVRWRTADLVRACKAVPATTLYDWLRGDSPINSDHLGCVLDALCLGITTRWATPETMTSRPAFRRKNQRRVKRIDPKIRKRPVTIRHLKLRQVRSSLDYIDRFEVLLRGNVLGHLLVNTESVRAERSGGAASALHFEFEARESPPVPSFSMNLVDTWLYEDALVVRRIAEALKQSRASRSRRSASHG